MLRQFQGDSPQLGRQVFVDESAVVTGRVKLGDDASVWPLVSIRGDLEWITIGARSNIQDNSCLHTTHKSEFNPEGAALTIGEDVTIGHSVTLHGCTIYNRVLVGMNALVLDRAVVHDDVMIGANSLVPPGKVLESGCLYLGSPVKRVRPLSEQELLFLKYSAQNYVKLKDAHMLERG